jgi:predicted DNA-binding transcriptional regulator AlpA
MNASGKASPIEPLLHPREAARILSVSLSWLAKSRLSGEGPRFVKIGRAVRYLESSLREFIKGRTRGSTSESD